jgi:hypothetical protein
MNRFSVRKQDHSQILAIHFVDLGPAPKSPVFLYHFANRAAKRAVFDAIPHSSLGFPQLVGKTANNMGPKSGGSGAEIKRVVTAYCVFVV